MVNPNEQGYSSKYAYYRKVRHDRAYRTLGKMNIYRIIIGVLLLIFVLFLSGTVSGYFASRGDFRTAKKLMVSPKWMEEYKPDTVDFFEAGIIYQDGSYEEALDAFVKIEDYPAALTMANASRVHIAEERCSSGDYDGAFELIKECDRADLPAEALTVFDGVCTQLSDIYSAAGDSARLSTLEGLADHQ